MKFILSAIAIIVLLFFLLGLKSQKGKAKGQPEKKVAPLNGTLEKIKAAILATGGTITSETNSYLSATYMSKIFKFIDDVEIRHEKENIWHIRSASRVGYSDRGVNRKRVEAIRAAID